MPSASKHLKRALAHKKSAERIAEAGEYGWAAVATFYAARELAHAVFDSDADLRAEMRHPTSHSDVGLNKPGTNVVIKRHYRQVEEEYLDLYGISLSVRYRGQVADESTLHDAQRNLLGVMRWAAFMLTYAQREVPEWLTP